MPRRYLPTIILTLIGLAVAAMWVPREQAAVAEHLAGFPDADPTAHQLRPVVLAVLCFLPALGGLLYGLAGTMARYVARQFLGLLGLCFVALLVIWLLIDFQDNLNEFQKSAQPFRMMGELYAAQFPEIFITLIPYALLLSLLFCLGRLSASREIIAMIQTGRGLARVTTPFLVTGLLATLFSMGLNYQWAPASTATEQRVMNSINGQDASLTKPFIFRNPRVRRTWMVQSFPPDFSKGAPLRNVRVVQENDDASLKSMLTANEAVWDGSAKTWTFSGAVLRHLNGSEAPRFDHDLPEPYVVSGWRETPAEIVQPGLPAYQLGIPDLVGWLKGGSRGDRARDTHRTQWHHRFSQPFNCLIMVLLATPLGVVFSRRGTSSGVALAIFLSAGLLFATTIFLTLGDSGHLPPVLAAWLPNIIFGMLAIILFRRRLAGRPIYQTIRRILPSES